MTQKGLGSVLPVFLLAEVGISEVTMGALLAISPTLRTVFMYQFGRVTDKVGRKPLIVIGLVGAGLQALALAGAQAPDALVARVSLAAMGFVIHAITFSALTTGTIAFIGDVAPVQRESELMGLRTTARGVGRVIGPLLIGVVATLWSYEVAFVGSSVLAFAAAGLAILFLIESRPESSHPFFGIRI